MCGYCSQLDNPASLPGLPPGYLPDPGQGLRGEALLALLIRLLYGVNEGRLELLRGEHLWPAVLGQAPAQVPAQIPAQRPGQVPSQVRQELPPTEHFDFGCLACSSILRLHMDLRRYVARWSLLLDHQPGTR